jgi:hypothetical protein
MMSVTSSTRRDGGELVERAVDAHAVIAAPWSDERSTRRSELPSVMPKPRSSGSHTNFP